MGIATGGLFDGIVLHQLLQWHHVVSNKVPDDTLVGLEQNILADGIFHQAMWIMAVVGIFLLYRHVAYSRADARGPLLPGLLIGFGLFNIFDSVVMHWTLGLHNIRPGVDWLVYDLAYAAWGGAMLLAGLVLARRSRAREEPPAEARRAAQ